MKKIILKAGEGERVKNAHKRVFSNEIKNVEASPKAGDIVLLYGNNE